MTFKEAVEHVKPVHVKAALDEIDRGGIPTNRKSQKWCLSVGDRRYPPKYVFAIATRLATNHTLSPDLHGGGKQTNDALIKLGFTIVLCPEGSNVREY